MRFVGLTNNPKKAKKEHGNPVDWKQWKFLTNEEAEDWLEGMLSKPNYTGKKDEGKKEWKYGYSYTITHLTHQKGIKVP